jgi:hypothetical protein
VPVAVVAGGDPRARERDGVMERRRGDGRKYQRPNKAGGPCWYVWWWANGKDNYRSVAQALHKRPEDVTEKEAEAFRRKMIRGEGVEDVRADQFEARDGPYGAGGVPGSPRAQEQNELKSLSELPAHLLERKEKSLRGRCGSWRRSTGGSETKS